MDRSLLDFLSALDAVDSLDGAWNRIVAFMESQGAGIAHAVFGHDPATIQFLTSCPDWWVPFYMENEVLAVDPLAHHSAVNSSPIAYDTERLASDKETHARLRKALGAGIDGFELKSGIVFPIHSLTRGMDGAINFGSSLDGPELQKLIDDKHHILHLAAMIGHTKLQGLLQKQKAAAIRLSPRERECLLWLAKGYRTQRIAEKTGLADITVNIYIANARKKLDAATREQAVARAIMLGLVDP